MSLRFIAIDDHQPIAGEIRLSGHLYNEELVTITYHDNSRREQRGPNRGFIVSNDKLLRKRSPDARSLNFEGPRRNASTSSTAAGAVRNRLSNLNMPLNTITVGAAVTPTVLATYVSHYTNRKPLHQKPTAHIAYHEGLRLICSFLECASHHTVEEIQAFTSQWVPCPHWVKVDQVTLSPSIISKAASVLIDQLGPKGVEKVGGSRWWQWRPEKSELRAEWIEMRGDYDQRKLKGDRGRRVILYVHGGAYFFGSVDEHRYQLQRHARKLRARVFAPRYRLAPQFPFPCGLQDCLAAYLYLLTLQVPEEIILAGDSAGAGMIVSVLVMLRDQRIPLPAGAILISPWVDLTHSFPSVSTHNDLDYIPAHGFMQRPSVSWPPPNGEEMAHIMGGRIDGSEAAQTGPDETGGNVTSDPVTREGPRRDARRPGEPMGVSKHTDRSCSPDSNASHHLCVEIDGEKVTLRDQIQLYTTNQLLSHPLVSPILQPSLGGLPPLLILTGGGEVLRDEQIYLAHKAACPEKFPIVGLHQEEHDPGNHILTKYPPTNVQLQVWEDLCHVAPTLSFTRPAKFMYRSIAQFGAWALARAQRRSIEITDDDDVSVISVGSDTDSSSLSDEAEAHKMVTGTGDIGKAGDPLPAFKNHMIRQLVTRHGRIYAMAPASRWEALQIPASEVGIIKPEPVRKWLAARQEWDRLYSSDKRKVQRRRIHTFADRACGMVEDGEKPPPSALVGRVKKTHLASDKRLKKGRSWGMTLWSIWGSKHDKMSIKREEQLTGEVHQSDGSATTSVEPDDRKTVGDQEDLTGPIRLQQTTTNPPPKSRRKSRTKSFGGADAQKRPSSSRVRSRTVTVSDQGQTEGSLENLRREHQEALARDVDFSQAQAIISSSDTTLLSPAPSLRDKLAHSDFHGGSQGGQNSPDDAHVLSALLKCG